MTKMLAPALLILALISISAEAAKFYKWVDKDGVTHYSAQPPADAPAETLNLRTGQSSKGDGAREDNSGEADSAADRDTSGGQATDTDDAKAQARAREEDEKNRARCDEALKTQAELANKPRVKVWDEKTNAYRVLPDEELQAWRDEVARAIRQYCD